jgi:hypothetical protein
MTGLGPQREVLRKILEEKGKYTLSEIRFALIKSMETSLKQREKKIDDTEKKIKKERGETAAINIAGALRWYEVDIIMVLKKLIRNNSVTFGKSYQKQVTVPQLSKEEFKKVVVWDFDSFTYKKNDKLKLAKTGEVNFEILDRNNYTQVLLMNKSDKESKKLLEKKDLKKYFDQILEKSETSMMGLAKECKIQTMDMCSNFIVVGDKREYPGLGVFVYISTFDTNKEHPNYYISHLIEFLQERNYGNFYESFKQIYFSRVKNKFYIGTAKLKTIIEVGAYPIFRVIETEDN